MTTHNNAITLHLSFRISEKKVSETGTQLDQLVNLETDFEKLTDDVFHSSPTPLTKLTATFVEQGMTTILIHQLGKAFSAYRPIAIAQQTIVKLTADNLMGIYELIAASAWLRSTKDFDQVDGADLIFILTLKPVQAEPQHTLSKRPHFANDALRFLRDLGVIQATFTWSIAASTRAGFYTFPDTSLPEDAREDHVLAYHAISAYLFLNYLTCLRVERQLLKTSPNQNWDIAYKKSILIQRQLVTIQKFALLKNRITHSSTLLTHFSKLLTAFRITEQHLYLSQLANDVKNLLEAESIYRSTKRIASIQWILFISTVLSLSIAINAIQMKPFYEADTANTLMRPVFWVVIGLVLAGAGIMSYLLSHGSLIASKFKLWLRPLKKESAT
ncbi:MAG: hypothetical protein QM533_03790 [Cytophagales bacterium]|nr:hypothetical protein [Cytophagales bacterium]